MIIPVLASSCDIAMKKSGGAWLAPQSLPAWANRQAAAIGGVSVAMLAIVIGTIFGQLRVFAATPDSTMGEMLLAYLLSWWVFGSIFIVPLLLVLMVAAANDVFSPPIAGETSKPESAADSKRLSALRKRLAVLLILSSVIACLPFEFWIRVQDRHIASEVAIHISSLQPNETLSWRRPGFIYSDVSYTPGIGYWTID